MPTGPLGLRDNTGLSQTAVSKISTIESWSLTKPMTAAVSKNELSSSEVDEVAEELRRFFALNVIKADLSRSIVLAPSGKIDLLWHRFILETEDYFDFCDTVFGSYLHHRTGDVAVSTEEIEDFLDEFFESFDAMIWGGPKVGCCPPPC